MRLHYWQAPKGNFGDDLNEWLWPRILPELEAWSSDQDWIWVGIGTLLNEDLPAQPEKLLFTPGAGYFEEPPQVDSTWHIYALRGPITARLLGVSDELAVTDGAALVRDVKVPGSEQENEGISYVPHHRSAKDGGSRWQRVCTMTGLRYVDPRRPVDDVLAAISGSKLVVAEALHAAIVADVFGIPWIPVRSEGILSLKWEDWCASVKLEYAPTRLPSLWNRPQEESVARAGYREGKEILTAGILHWLTRRGRRYLSDRRVLENRLSELRIRLDQVRKDLKNGRIRGHSHAPRREWDKHHKDSAS